MVFYRSVESQPSSPKGFERGGIANLSSLGQTTQRSEVEEAGTQRTIPRDYQANRPLPKEQKAICSSIQCIRTGITRQHRVKIQISSKAKKVNRAITSALTPVASKCNETPLLRDISMVMSNSASSSSWAFPSKMTDNRILIDTQRRKVKAAKASCIMLFFQLNRSAIVLALIEGNYLFEFSFPIANGRTMFAPWSRL